jgi:mono/diheme cytochrome c family protein
MALAVLVLGGVLPAWGSLPDESIQPAAAIVSPSTDEPRQRPIKSSVPSRGQLLYENHCMACHESIVHIRTQQQVQSLPELQAQVGRWAEYLQLRWSKEEVEDVVDYLDRQYYQFASR